MAELRENHGQLVFGLDIGTRSIVGTVGYLEGNKFHVVEQCIKEHETRAMLDGQIHDIGKVGETISSVKKELERRLGRNLNEVCIAAAGRVLRTVTTAVEQGFETEKEITSDDIYALAMAGVEQAYGEFQQDNDSDLKFYCVGYTPVRYYMNGYQIGNLEGHKAKHIGIELIATFLPDDVVDGLYKAVELADLHVANLTLEPIAAIQVAIPEKFRMLNMALVDVGAGTSDISITKEGTITAYGMIPVAGDSLTEIIQQHCLVDFENAEQIKRKSGVQEVVEYLDIMGLPQTITAEEVRGLIEDAVSSMTAQVAQCIKELNGDKPVSAVFVVGGGGMVPGYTEKLAEHLGIVKERVAIRGQEVMQSIVFDMEDAVKDSLMVTPIGICLSYYEQSNNFIFLEFNGNRIKLYDNGKLTVADAAVQCAFPNASLFPKRGEALTFTVNGKPRIIRGQQGESCVIMVNEAVADLYTQVHSGDIISITPSTAGTPAVQELGKLAEFGEGLTLYVHAQKMEMPKCATVNGKRENEFYLIKEGDDIQIHNYYTVAEIAEFLDLPMGDGILVNDTPAKADTRVYENFTVTWDLTKKAEPAPQPKVEAPITEAVAESPIVGVKPAPEEIEVTSTQSVTEETVPEFEEAAEYEETYDTEEEAEQEPVEEEVPMQSAETATEKENASADVAKEGAAASQPAAAPTTDIIVIVNNQTYLLSGKLQYVFVDVFSVINFDLKASGGRGIVTTLNGRPAEFMEPIHEGDIIEIYWKEKVR